MSRTARETAIRAHAEQGGTVVLATHDVELAARAATRVVVDGVEQTDDLIHMVNDGRERNAVVEIG